MDHTDIGNTLHTRCEFYRRVCDLPAVVDPPQLQRISMRAGRIWALMMPSPLGAAVRIRMDRQGSQIGPILSHPRSNHWSFLIVPDLPFDASLFASLFSREVSVVRDGGTIALPSPSDSCSVFREWIELPSGPFRPSGRVVVDAIEACTSPLRKPIRKISHV
ncbi:DNA-directed RNA polymerase subunit beta [Nocardia brasiliensis]|uniref:DNA-directed RNA polymerase subunit beta n=1 Tax=Nocardia brasiliensis TaxID=37326 RepID=A0A6G9XYC8_NOCBR|nr:DNA-directed RNA polymerase subunit beta [Nocardia brasiliensis]QIS05949.1 DNA-directed RNA polymerase subunit beta [Nocardia brasiliensis]